MKYYITYFYNIRFLKENTIPISTAMWDPKWFHDGKTQDYIFKDKRNVYNGIRMVELSPYKLEHTDCCKDCPLSPSSCDFIKDYSNYLHSLDFNTINDKIISFAKMLQQQKNLRMLPDICLLVHEKPDNPCSERKPLIDWFKENGIELIEFEKGIK